MFYKFSQVHVAEPLNRGYPTENVHQYGEADDLYEVSCLCRANCEKEPLKVIGCGETDNADGEHFQVTRDYSVLSCIACQQKDRSRIGEEDDESDVESQ